jgi:hypothetical protein
MTTETMNALLVAAEALGVKVEARQNYSGRGMFGATTCALVVPNRGILTAVAARAAAELAYAGRDDIVNDLIEDLTQLRWDSMGQDAVCY